MTKSKSKSSLQDWMIIWHDCERDEHAYTVVGPFVSKKEADTFIVKYALSVPIDGGYSFGTAVLSDGRDMESPDEYFDWRPNKFYDHDWRLDEWQLVP